MPHSCFADEIAIDFPAVGRVIDGIRDAFLGQAERSGVVAAEVSVSRREAAGGHVVIGVFLRRRQHRARLVALLVGSIDLLLLPYGTALGCYALWVLLSERGKALFGTAM